MKKRKNKCSPQQRRKDIARQQFLRTLTKCNIDDDIYGWCFGWGLEMRRACDACFRRKGWGMWA